jgi:hypothetical protein
VLTVSVKASQRRTLVLPYGEDSSAIESEWMWPDAPIVPLIGWAGLRAVGWLSGQWQVAKPDGPGNTPCGLFRVVM